MKFQPDLLEQKLADAKSVSAGRVHWFDEIASTNDFISGHPDSHGRVCLAGLQTAGRGQRGKQWQAPAMSSILMSFGWDLSGAGIGGLSLVCGLAVTQALESANIGSVTLKWPNDVLLDGEKLGGILVEVSGRKAVIGIGINLDMGSASNHAQYPLDTRLPWTDLAKHNYSIDFHNLAAGLIIQLGITLDKFVTHGFGTFRTEWIQTHYFHGRVVQLNGAQTVEGRVTGIDEMGGLILDVDGVSRVFYAGEVSMTPVEESA